MLWYSHKIITRSQLTHAEQLVCLHFVKNTMSRTMHYSVSTPHSFSSQFYLSLLWLWNASIADVHRGLDVFRQLPGGQWIYVHQKDCSFLSSSQATIKEGKVAWHREVIKMSKRVAEKTQKWEFLFVSIISNRSTVREVNSIIYSCQNTRLT